VDQSAGSCAAGPAKSPVESGRCWRFPAGVDRLVRSRDIALSVLVGATKTVTFDLEAVLNGDSGQVGGSGEPGVQEPGVQETGAAG
jgi:hypothetical protein